MDDTWCNYSDLPSPIFYHKSYEKLNKTEFMTKDQKTYVDNIINDLLSIEVDGETMEYIVRSLNLENQILWQLMMNASDTEIYSLIDERRSFYDSNNDGYTNQSK